MVLIACHCFWVVENPRQSLLVRYFRFEQLCNWISFVAGFQKGCTISHSITNLESHFPQKKLFDLFPGLPGRFLDAAAWWGMPKKNLHMVEQLEAGELS